MLEYAKRLPRGGRVLRREGIGLDDFVCVTARESYSLLSPLAGRDVFFPGSLRDGYFFSRFCDTF